MATNHFKSPLRESNAQDSDNNVKLIPEKSPSFKPLPPLTITKKSRTPTNKMVLSPTDDGDFQHSINSTPLAHKENVIPVKSSVQSHHHHHHHHHHHQGGLHNSSITLTPKSKTVESSLNLPTPHRKLSLSLLHESPIPDLTPPPPSMNSKIYESINTPSSINSKRSVSSPINMARSPNTTPSKYPPSMSRPNSLGIRKVSTPISKRRVSGKMGTGGGSSSSKQFKSPLKMVSSTDDGGGGGGGLSPFNISQKNSKSFTLGLKSLSKNNETFDKVYNFSKNLDDEIEMLKKQNSTLTSYKNLKLNDPKTAEQDFFLVNKWQEITEKVSQVLLELYHEKILGKHGSFRQYKLSKYEQFRKSLKWQLLNAIDEKFDEIKSSEEFEKLSDYEKNNMEKDYNYSKKSTLDDFNRQCDAKFRAMFKDDIMISRSRSQDATGESSSYQNNSNTSKFSQYANNENDVLDEYTMKDLYKDLNLDFGMVFGKPKQS
ncbi:hypothetical protein DASC09_035770 [Saccharomycopsis crataegensis]|uniref:Uncharacterized protein n=1 Tax=Saccharomycopsis crataegensis TaxID=43959 RepID=A0AAV5QN65_9ASCO|nr:hypothetical protein DASC09_035770 [Saccharomycopsis crataegensis]